ncbi:MAG: EAL domain-containing protein [Pseudomonadota bacterium]
MTNTALSVSRKLGPRDLLRIDELEPLSAILDPWMQGTREGSVDELLEALGDHAAHISVMQACNEGPFLCRHFGQTLAMNAGFDMTGKTSSAFDPQTRVHVEQSFRAALDQNEVLTTIIPSSQGSTINSWQRIIFPVKLNDGPHLVTLVKPLTASVDAVHAREDDVAVCVVPLRHAPEIGGFKPGTHEPIKRYLGDGDWAEIEAFTLSVPIPGETPPVGALVATTSLVLNTNSGEPISLLMDVVQGFTTPFLVIFNATEWALTSNKLRKTKHLLKTSFQLGKLGSWTIFGTNDARVRMADELVSLYGLEPDKKGFVSLDSVRALYDDDLRRSAFDGLKACYETGDSFVVEGGITRNDGERRQVRTSGSAMRDQTNRIIGVFGLTQDITEEFAVQAQLKESEERFRDFAATASDWCWETDAEHRFIDFTKGYESLGLSLRSAYMGKTRRELHLVEEDRPIIEEHFKDLEARREFSDLVYRYCPPEKDAIMTIKVSGKPLFDAGGKFLGYRGTARDITASMEAKRLRAEHQAALKDAQSIAKLGHWSVNLGARTANWSPEILKLLMIAARYDYEDVPYWKQILRGIHRNDRRLLVTALHQAARGEVTEPVDVRFFQRDAATPLYLRVIMRKKTSKPWEPQEITGVAQDVSALKRTQAELEKRTQHLSEAHEMGRIGDWYFNVATKKLTWSDNLYNLLGYEPEALAPSLKAVRRLLTPKDGDAFRAHLKDVLAGKQTSRLDVQARRGDSTFGYYTLSTRSEFDSRGRLSGLIGTIQDITERKRTEKQLRNLAYYDPLTGLANRSLFSRELEKLIEDIRADGGSAALLLLDLDHFKEVNDTLGHAAGDELLRSVGRLLTPYVTESNFVARLGGDEFAIIVRNYPSIDELETIARGVVDKLRRVLKLRRGEVLIGTSVGVSLIPQDGGSAEEALRNADLALYMAKDEGRGKALFFRPEMSQAAQARINLARELRQAIERDDLETRYQGQVDLRTNRVLGFEALVRWKHPTRGYISPAEFIPVAESSNLICDIGLWVLRDACRTGREWLDRGEPERIISVNVSTAQIWQSDFEDDVLKIIEEIGYPPHLLCLELTESVFADHGEGRVRQALSRFKEVGIQLAVDDFGTGYSSLGYLNDLPFDSIKIDRCFVSNIDTSPDKGRLLQGVIALGRGLGMRVVGEGAEETGEVALLREYGCDVVQGFVYTKPEPAEDALRSAEQLEFQLAETFDSNDGTHAADDWRKAG